jgi:hypothetical protein
MHKLERPSRAPLPVFRAAMFSVVGTALGMSLHHLVAEAPTPWTQGATVFGGLFAVGLAVTRRPRSLFTVVAVCVGAQAALHTWLTAADHGGWSAGGASAVDMHGGGPHGALGHAQHGGVYGHGQHADVLVTGPAALHDSVTMTAAHFVVAVFVAALLHRADAVCWSLACGLSNAAGTVRGWIAWTLALLAGCPAALGPGPGHGAVTAVKRDRPSPWGAMLAHALLRRGPPPTGMVSRI